MNVNPYAQDFDTDPFAEMAALIPNASDSKPSVVMTTKAEVTVAKTTLSEADYYEQQLITARAMFAEYEQTIKDMVADAKALKVESAEEEQKALDLGLPLDRLYKRIEEARVSFVDKPSKHVKAVNSLAKHYQSLIDDGRQAVKAQLSSFARQKAIEAQRRAIEEQKARDEARKAAEAEMAKLKAEAEKAGVKAPDIELPPPVETAPPLQSKKRSEAPKARPPWSKPGNSK